MERFQKIYSQGIVSVMEIWVDTETGVHYLFHRDGNGAGFTPVSYTHLDVYKRQAMDS